MATEKGREIQAAFRIIGGQDKDTGDKAQLAVVEIDTNIYALAVAPYYWNTGALDKMDDPKEVKVGAKGKKGE